jgi:hypothetical protein
VAFSEHMDLAWAEEANPAVDVLFDDASRDGPNRLRLFVFLAATYGGGNQPVSAQLRRVLGGAESCGALDTSSPSDVSFCSAVAAVPSTDATCTLSQEADVEDITACAGVTGADLGSAVACEALQTADADDGDTRACVYTDSVVAQSLASACAAAGTGQCGYSAAYSPADALAAAATTPFDSELLRTVGVPSSTRVDEWHQLLADFYVLPAERPCVLRLQLQAGGRYSGMHIGRPGPLRNVAQHGSVSSSGSLHYRESQRDVNGRRVSDAILTNGVIQDEQWFFLDTLHSEVPYSELINTPEIITMQVDLGTVYHICALRVEWVASAMMLEWTLDIRGGTSGSSGWVEKLNIVHGTALPETAGGGMVDARSTSPYYFACGEATQIRFTMARSQNSAYGLRELELTGFEVAEHGPCVQACQHGAGCWDARDGCTCVPSWFWRGDTCGTDCTVPLTASVEGADFCLASKRERCWADDGLCGACLDGNTVSERGIGVSTENVPCEAFLDNACGDPDASNYAGLARPDDDYGCEYAEIVVSEAQEEAVVEVAQTPEEPFSLSIPSVVIFILVGLFVTVIACFIVLHNRHSKRARVHHVGGSGHSEEDDTDGEEEEMDEESAARAARDRFLASQKKGGGDEGPTDDDDDGYYAEDGSDPYAHLSAHKQARAQQKAKAAAKAAAQQELNSSMSYPSAEQAGRGSKKGKKKKGNKSAWVAYTDDETGDTYYHNEETDETTWDKPAGM